MNRIRSWMILMVLLLLITPILSLVPQGQAAPTGTSSAYLPIIFSNLIRPVGGHCPGGTHIVHEESGRSDMVDPDTAEYSDNEYLCMPDQNCDDLPASPYGVCQITGGLAGYSCHEGYVGALCNICDWGYQPNATNDGCVLSDPAAPPPVILGADESLEAGQTRVLTVEGGGTYLWQIAEGVGCLVGPAACEATATGASVTFQAPATVEAIEMTLVTITPVGGGAAGSTSVKTVPAGSIPVTGYGSNELQPIVRALSDFMHHRCVGAAVIGVSYYGQPVGVWGLGRMDGRSAASGWNAECGNDPFVPGAGLVQEDTPFAMGSVSKPVTAAVLRELIRDRWEELNPGQVPTDSQIEALPVFGLNNPTGLLLPIDVVEVYNGTVPLPVNHCNQFAYADSRWEEITVGDLLGHNAGLVREIPSTETVVPDLPFIRGLMDEGDFAAQEQQLRDEWGDQAVDAARCELGYCTPGDAYVLPFVTGPDIVLYTAGTCAFENDPDTEISYSNLGYFFLTQIVAHLNGYYAATNGYPELHEGSALDEFFANELGIVTTASDGIYNSQRAWWVVGYPYPEVEKRSWDQGQNSYYPIRLDAKRPHCEWIAGEGCDFEAWLDGGLHINWRWETDSVPFWFEDSSGSNGGVGSLAAEAEVMLAFMENYWVNGYFDNPIIGQVRNQWNIDRRHNGALAGGYAWAIQYGPTGSSWLLPPQSPSGTILNEFSNLVSYQCQLPDGTLQSLPNGVDLFVAVNQRSDKQCINDTSGDGGDFGSDSCGEYYSLLDNFVAYGVCRVDWSTLAPPDISIGP
jgi:hypothetical protein